MNKKVTIDILMFIAIIAEFLSLPILIHEIVGIGLVLLIGLHLKENKRYFKGIKKGKYNLRRTFDLIVNIGLLLSLVVTIISGIFSAMKSLKGIRIGNHKISHIHKSSSIISLIFLALHLGVTHKKLLREMKKGKKTKKSEKTVKKANAERNENKEIKKVSELKEVKEVKEVNEINESETDKK